MDSEGSTGRSMVQRKSADAQKMIRVSGAESRDSRHDSSVLPGETVLKIGDTQDWRLISRCLQRRTSNHALPTTPAKGLLALA